MQLKRIATLCVLLVYCLIPLCGISEEVVQPVLSKCILRINGDKEVASQLFKTSVTVQIDDEDLKKDMLSLAFHIYSNTGELLYYEGERVRLENWQGNEVTVSREINLTSYGSVPLDADVIIEFDIVNETKGYWFSTSPGIKMDAEVITCKGGIIPRFIESANKLFHRPVTVLVNIVCIIAFIIIIIKLKRNNFSVI